MRTIGAKLTTSIVVLLLTGCVLLGSITYFTSAKAIKKQVEETLIEKSGDISHFIEERFARSFVELEALAENTQIKSMDRTAQNSYLLEQIKQKENYLAFQS